MPKIEFSKLKILVIDDHAPTRTTLTSILATAGIERVTAVANLADATEHLKQGRFDILLCDVNVAGENGLALVKEVRHNKNFTNRYMPIIVLSADSREGTIGVARRLGANHFLTKPVDPAILLDTVRNVIERPRAFFETKDYFGPDRRIRQESGADERRASDTAPRKLHYGDRWE